MISKCSIPSLVTLPMQSFSLNIVSYLLIYIPPLLPYYTVTIFKFYSISPDSSFTIVILDCSSFN